MKECVRFCIFDCEYVFLIKFKKSQKSLFISDLIEFGKEICMVQLSRSKENNYSYFSVEFWIDKGYCVEVFA